MLEDEEDVRQTLCEQLHQLGWLTLETASGEEALQLLEASPDIALLISDLMLPGALSGADVIHTARRRFPALPVLLISGQDLRRRRIRPCRKLSGCVSRLPAPSWRRR